MENRFCQICYRENRICSDVPEGEICVCIECNNPFCHSSHHKDGCYFNGDCDAFYEMMAKARERREGRYIIYKDFSDFLNEEGSVRIYRTDDGWSSKRHNAKHFLREEASQLIGYPTEYHLEDI